MDRSAAHPAAPPRRCPYGSYEEMLDILRGQLETAPHLLGERFTAADLLWGAALRWTMTFGLVARDPVFAAYVQRIYERPAVQRAAAADEALAAAQAA